MPSALPFLFQKNPFASSRQGFDAGERYTSESLQNDRGEDARYCWAFFNTYTQTCTLSHLMEIKPIKQRLFPYNQTT
jgi:hypothetical protein